MVQEATSSTFGDMLEARGVTRRSFLKLCGAVAAAAGLSQLAVPRVAQALEESVIGAKQGGLFPVLWFEGASCTGCTESLAQVETPDVGSIVLEMISLNYCDTLSAGAGHSLEQAKEQTIANGNYIVVHEGAITRAFDGQSLRYGGGTGMEHLREAAENAVAIVALGSCAVNGGWMAAYPNPADAVGVQQFLKSEGIDKPVVNIPGCPANPEWLVSILVEVIMMNGLDSLDLDAHGKPKGIFGQTVHDSCERRGHFENGEFVYKFGSEEEDKGYCLYALGCKGPQTKSNCSVVMWNNRRSWCVQAGSPCIGCCEATPMKPKANWVELNAPFYRRHRDLHIGNHFFQLTHVGVAVSAIVIAALAIHGFGMKKAGRTSGGADFEKVRAWDAKHPDRAIGQYEDSILDGDPKKLMAAQLAVKAENAERAAQAAQKAAEKAKAEAEKAAQAAGLVHEEDIAATAEAAAEEVVATAAAAEAVVDEGEGR